MQGIEAAFRAPRQAQTFVFCHSTSSHKIPHEVGVMHTFMHMCEHSISQGLVFEIQSIWKRWLYKPSEWGIEDAATRCRHTALSTPEKQLLENISRGGTGYERPYRIATLFESASSFQNTQHDMNKPPATLDEAGCQWSRWAAFLFCSFKPLLEKPLWHDILTFRTFASGTPSVHVLGGQGQRNRCFLE